MREDLQQKIDMSIKRLQSFAPPEGYFVAFSGGKDSIVIKNCAILQALNMTHIIPSHPLIRLSWSDT